MTSDSPHTSQPAREHSWLYNHIGRLAGIVLGVVAIAFVALLAFVGFHPAQGLLAFLIVVFVMIAVGGRLHGL